MLLGPIIKPRNSISHCLKKHFSGFRNKSLARNLCKTSWTISLCPSSVFVKIRILSMYTMTTTAISWKSHSSLSGTCQATCIIQAHTSNLSNCHPSLNHPWCKLSPLTVDDSHVSITNHIFFVNNILFTEISRSEQGRMQKLAGVEVEMRAGKQKVQKHGQVNCRDK